MEGSNSKDAISRAVLDIDWERLEEAFAALDRPPEGTFLARDYAEREGLQVETARKRLDKLVSAGALQRIKKGVRVYYSLKE